MEIIGSIALVAAAAAIWLAPRALVAVVATGIGLWLGVAARRSSRVIVDLRASNKAPDFDRKLSRAERLVMKRSLRIALDQTELRSLFPALMAGIDVHLYRTVR